VSSDTVIDVLERLETLSGRLEKEAVLRANVSNELLKRVFVAAQDQFVTYHVSKFKMPRANGGNADEDSTIAAFLETVLVPLQRSEWTGNRAKDELVEFLMCCSEREQKWCQRIILRNLRVGVQESTVNRIWPGAIQTFEVMLAHALKAEHVRGQGIKILDKVTYPVRVEPKLDGLRCVTVKRSGNVTMWTRNGTLLETLPRIKKLIEDISTDDIVFDGEVLAKTNDWNTSASVVMSHKTKKDDVDMVYHVFDALPIDEWDEQSSKMTLYDRVACVANVLSGLDTESIVQVKGVTCEDEAEMLNFYAKCLEDGVEGVMIKDLDAPYEFKRSRSLRKLKPVATYEGVIVGWELGRKGGKRESEFGGFLVAFPSSVGSAVTRVGGGYTDSLKREIQDNDPETYVGKIVEIEGQADVTTSDGLSKDGRVRFPQFMRFRDPSDVDPKVIAAGTEHLRSRS